MRQEGEGDRTKARSQFTNPDNGPVAVKSGRLSGVSGGIRSHSRAMLRCASIFPMGVSRDIGQKADPLTKYWN